MKSAVLDAKVQKLIKEAESLADSLDDTEEISDGSAAEIKELAKQVRAAMVRLDKRVEKLNQLAEASVGLENLSASLESVADQLDSFREDNE